MREIRQAANDPSFLLKALSEAAGELQRSYHGLKRAELLRRGEGFDDCWCLLSIAVHLRDVEEEAQEQFELMLDQREPELRHVDLDAVPLEAGYLDADEDEALDDFRHLRHETSYLLWDLTPKAWERGGHHPYRGRITVLEFARDLYQHDLEHLWQVRRMLDRVVGARPRR